MERQSGKDTPQKLTLRISKQIASRGVLDVLRKGVKDRGCSFDLTYFQPASGMNPDHQRLYAQNRFSLIRQLHYSQRNEKSVDMVLFLNGLPLATDGVTEDNADEVSDIDARILEEMEQRRMQDHISYYRFCLAFYEASQPDELLHGILDGVVKQWAALEIDGKEKFRSTLQSYIRLYGYISQLITFTDVALEKLYIFGRSLNKKLPKREYPDVQDVLTSVDLDSFRVQKTYDSLQLSLEARDSEVEGIGSEVATMRDPEQDLLSNIIQALNDAYQTDFTMEDKVDIATIHQKVLENEELRQVIEGDNTDTNKRYKFDQVIDDILLDFVNSKLVLYTKLSKPEINDYLKQHLYQAYLAQPSSAVQKSD